MIHRSVLPLAVLGFACAVLGCSGSASVVDASIPMVDADTVLTDAGPVDASAHDAASQADAAAIDAATTDASLQDAGAASGFGTLCYAGTPTTSTLDPNCVYLLGTLTPGSSDRDVLIRTNDPDHYLAGFSSAYQPKIRPDGRLLFLDRPDSSSDVLLRIFVDDPLVDGGFPPHTLNNDTLLATPECSSGVQSIDFASGSGTVYYECSHNYGQYYRMGTAGVAFDVQDDNLLAISPTGIALVGALTHGAPARLIAPGQTTTLTGFTNVRAARWVNGAFLAATLSQDNLDNWSAALYRVSPSGQVSKISDYVFDQTAQTQWLFGECILEPTGAMWCITDSFAGGIGSDNKIWRYTTNAAPTLEYDEALHQVKIHISFLVSGR